MNSGDKHILIVEDDGFLRDGLAMLLEREQFTVRLAGSISEAEDAFSDETCLIILDVGLPDGNGFDYCRHIRKENKHVPILFLTARDEEYDVVRGFELGGNDYITKPFRSLELIARVRALLRRATPDDTPTEASIVLHPSRLQASVDGRIVSLTPTEFSLLHKLISNKDQSLSREQLLAALWDGDGQYIDDNTLSVNIFRLRDKIGHEAIETIRGVGYRWRGLK